MMGFFKNVGNISIILKVIFRIRRPIIPPSVFKMMSSISNTLPIRGWIISMTNDEIAEKIVIVSVFFIFK